MWSRIHLIPLLQAEEDRDLVRRYLADKAREKELLGSETSAYNSDRHVPQTDDSPATFTNLLLGLYGRHSQSLRRVSRNRRGRKMCYLYIFENVRVARLRDTISSEIQISASGSASAESLLLKSITDGRPYAF